VPDIFYVIDFGLVKQQQQEDVTFLSALRLVWESQASAKQARTPALTWVVCCGSPHVGAAVWAGGPRVERRVVLSRLQSVFAGTISQQHQC
jgi:hypothetical protein